MQRNALCGLRLLSGLLAFAVAGSHGEGVRLLAQHIELVGPRQWLGPAAGSFVAATPVIAPVSQRLAGVFARRAKLLSETAEVPAA